MYSIKNISEKNKINMVPVLNQELMHIIGERGKSKSKSDYNLKSGCTLKYS